MAGRWNVIGLVSVSVLNAMGFIAIGGINAVGVVAIGGVNVAVAAAIGGVNSRSALPLLMKRLCTIYHDSVQHLTWNPLID